MEAAEALAQRPCSLIRSAMTSRPVGRVKMNMRGWSSRMTTVPDHIRVLRREDIIADAWRTLLDLKDGQWRNR